MSAEVIVTLVATFVGSAGLATLISGANSLSRGARLRHRIEKDSALAATFPENSEARVALDLLRSNAAHELSAHTLFPMGSLYRVVPLMYGGAGVIFAVVVLVALYGFDVALVAEDERTGFAFAMVLVGLVYLLMGMAIRARFVRRWQEEARDLLREEVEEVLTSGKVGVSRWEWKLRAPVEPPLMMSYGELLTFALGLPPGRRKVERQSREPDEADTHRGQEEQ